MVKIPATAAGVPAIRQMISEGRNINVTLIFSLERYDEVLEAYLSGLEACERRPLATSPASASFFISRVDTEIDRRLEAIGSPEALALRGKAAVAQGKLAYEQFRTRFSGPRWDHLVAAGRQGPAAALGVDLDEEPRLPRHALRRLAHRPGHDQHAARRHDRGVRRPRHPGPHRRRRRGRGARYVAGTADVGVDMDDVARTLETEGRGVVREELRGAPRRPRHEGRRPSTPTDLHRPFPRSLCACALCGEVKRSGGAKIARFSTAGDGLHAGPSPHRLSNLGPPPSRR